MRKIPLILGLLMPATVMAQTKGKAEIYNIYVPGSYTGEVPFVAKDIFAAVKYFADDTNKKGGLLGRRIELIQQDDKANVVTALENAKIAIADPNHLLTIGHNFSSIALPIGKHYASEGKLFMTPYATSSKISEIGGTSFQLCYNDTFQGQTLGDVAFTRLKSKRVAVVTNQSDVYSQGLAEEFIKRINTLNGKSKSVEVKQINFINAMLEPKDIVKQIAEFKADLIFLPENKMKAAELIRVFQESEVADVTILGADGWGSEHANIGMYFDKAKDNKKNPNYFYTYHWVSSIDTAVNKNYTKALTDAKGEKVYGPGVLTYEGLVHLANLAKQNKTADNRKLAGYIRGSSYTGTTGKVYFDSAGHTVRDLVLLKLGVEGLIVDSFVQPK
jgi:branched-chain amino acid transport system substrate-binding protein